jgi:hypothetical protein
MMNLFITVISLLLIAALFSPVALIVYLLIKH